MSKLHLFLGIIFLEIFIPNMPLYIDTTFCVSVHLSMDTGLSVPLVNNAAVRISYKYLLESLFSIPLGSHLPVELLDAEFF